MTLHEDPKSAQIDNSSSTTSHSPVIGGAATKPNMEVKGKSDLSSSSEMSHFHASDGAAKQKAMDVKEKSDHSKCSVCGKDAISVCKACKRTPDGAGGVTGVYYCSAACQKQDWPSHKIKCKAAKDRRILYRAGDIAQRLFIVFCQASWCSDFLLDFPVQLFPNVHDQEAILTQGACRAAMYKSETLIKNLLK
ncbi:MAG: hypothetical protein Q9205_007944, partial [Flavoplaca limonia]